MSSINVAQFHKVFFEESLEGLDAMEAALLALDDGGDKDLVHSIFRAAHSIKGGAATFGFPDMAAFTHEAESLLDQVRDGRRGIEKPIIELMLRAVDCLRGMFDRAQTGQPLADTASVSLKQELAAMVGDTGTAQAEKVSSTAATQNGWLIQFRPHIGMLAGGNDPLRLLRELSALGSMQVVAQCDRLPSLDALDPGDCHLGWRIELAGAVNRASIANVFEWVEDECDLTIEPIAPAKAESLPATVEPDLVPAMTNAPMSATRATGGANDASSVRVGIDKIDSLIDMVGELVITQAMLDQFREEITPESIGMLQQGLAQLARHTRSLQESVMGIRMLPISSVFNRFPRLVRDLTQKLGKHVKLELVGEHTELDKTVLEKIGDPLVHLVRNAIDHGMEMPDKRRAAGKSEVGTLRLEAAHKGGSVVLKIVDDGAGLNREAIIAKALQKGLIKSGEGLSDEAVGELIFQPGFSTAAVTTDLSGRGVGMDVVRRNVVALGGGVSILSQPGKGTTFTITLPLTLAIIDGLSAAVGEETYIIPLVSIVESVQLKADAVRFLASVGELFRFRNEWIPLIRLADVFNCASAVQAVEQGLAIVVESDGARVGLFVDRLVGQQQAVVKSLEANYQRVQGISGATILANGSVALITDVTGLIRLKRGRQAA